VFRHTGPENKGESTTPVTARAARLVQRKTGPSGTSSKLKRDDLGDSRSAVAIERKEPAEPPRNSEATQKDVLFEVGRNDPPAITAAPTPAATPVGQDSAALSAAAPSGISQQQSAPLSAASPAPPAMSAAQADSVIRSVRSSSPGLGSCEQLDNPLCVRHTTGKRRT
jgi:hypothetical protein